MAVLLPEERHLARFWQAGLLNRQPARLRDGRAIRLVYRGRASHGAGPDFCDAILDIGGTLVKGDVELHVRARDWFGHGHARDQRYANVVLHVIWQDDPLVRVTTPSGHEPAALVISTLFPSVDDLLRAAAVAPAPDEPYHTWIQLFDAEDLGIFLDHSGDRRFWRRAEQYEADLAVLPREEVLYRALLDALGYSQNRDPARLLAQRLPLGFLDGLVGGADGHVRLEGALLGAAGLLPSQNPSPRPLEPPDDGEARRRETAWAHFAPAWGEQPLGRAAWQFHAVRPSNAPPRRLAGAAAMLARHFERDLIDTVATALTRQPGRAAYRELTALAAVDGQDGYWTGRADFGRPLGRAAGLVGPDRAADIAVNVLLPLAAAIGATDGDRGLADGAQQTYAAAPRLGENWITREMTATVVGPKRRPAVNSARRQQGVLELYHACCSERRCATCPFAQTAAAWPQPASPDD